MDNDQRCSQWAVNGFCIQRPGFMLVNCKRSCNQCGRGGVGPGRVRPERVGPGTIVPLYNYCMDNDQRCSQWALNGFCIQRPGYMLVNCKRSCNQCGRGGVGPGRVGPERVG